MVSSSSTSPSSTPPRCNLNGVVDNNDECVCDAAWEGPECATLAVLPIPRASGYRHKNISSWGGNAVYDHTTDMYHGYFSEFVNHCGLRTWGLNSRIVHATSKTAVGPYEYVDEALPPQAHNAHIAYSNGLAGGKLLLWHIHVPNRTCVAPHYNCSVQCINGSTPPGLPHPPVSAPTTVPNPTPSYRLRTVNWTFNSGNVHSAASFNGPWIGVRGNISSCNNPSPWYEPNGASVRTCEGPMRYQPGVDLAPSGYLGPYTEPRFNVSCTGMVNQTNATGFHSEDPVIWRDTRGGYHMLSHAMGPWSMVHGVHAFSLDAKTWYCTPTPPYNGTIVYEDGEVVELAKRERPKILLDPKTREPIVLFSAATLHDEHVDDYSFTLAVPLKT